MFGSVFTVAKLPLASVNPLVLSGLVYTVSGIALIPFAKASFKFANRQEYLYLSIITALGGVGAPALLLFGLQITPASDASILANGEVIFTIALSALFFGERPKGRIGVLAVVMVTAGLFIATTDLNLSQTILSLRQGNLLILAAMLMWGIDNNISRRLTLGPTVSPAKVAMTKSLFGGLILLAIALLMHLQRDIAAISLSLWVVIVLMSVTGFGGALLLFLEGIKRIGTIKTMSVFSLTPVFGITAATVALHESISIFQILATGIIIAGIGLVSRR